LELERAIKERRSIRRYTDAPVPEELVRKVIEAGMWAPSAKNGQQWRFTVCTGASKDALTEVFDADLTVKAETYGVKVMGSSLASCRIMQQAPVLVMVWNAGGTVRGDRVAEAVRQLERMVHNARALGHKAEIQSVAAAIQNMLLMAHSLGLGSLWINNIYYALDAVEEHLDKPWELVAAVTLGWPTEPERRKPPPNKLTVDEVTEFRA
jgi:nitroreductase